MRKLFVWIENSTGKTTGTLGPEIGLGRPVSPAGLASSQVLALGPAALEPADFGSLKTVFEYHVKASHSSA